MTEEMNKAERLAVAGYAAPRMRGTSDVTRQRRVARVNKDGKVVGYTTLAEVQKALLRQREIELEVQDGVRPKEFMCERCGKPSKVGRLGVVPKRCKPCTRMTCSSCGKPKPARRHYRSTMCIACYRAKGPTPIPCIGGCGATVTRARSPRCSTCAGKAEKPRLRCADCDKELAKSARWASNVKARKGKPARCVACHRKARTAEEKAEASKKAWQKRRAKEGKAA